MKFISGGANMTNRVGQQLGNYRLIRFLGKGGFAEVYLGEHVYLKTPAAIKLLQTTVSNREDLEGFLKEAQTIAHLVHPHIVRLFDFGLDGETPFLVMDYAPDGTLRQRHPRGTQLPLTTIIPYVKQIAEALQYVHEEKFIHRDVKPENILVGRRDAVLLSDFGIALFAQSTRYQNTQEVTGTVAYMSPEQIRGKPRPASDQYSLGIVVYEWLTGDRPFHGSFTELCTQHIFASPPPLHEKLATLSPEVEQVVLTALEKEPHKRFASVRAFATALEKAGQPLLSTKVVTPPESPGPIIVPTLSSQSSQLTEVGDAIPPNQQSPQDAMNALPPQGTFTATPSSEPQVPKHGISRRAFTIGLAGLAAAVSGITFWVFSSKQHSPSTDTTPSTSQNQQSAVYTYRGHFELVLDVTWSLDGKRIASASADGTAQIWDATTGDHVLVYGSHSDEVRVVAWSPDGKRIASGSDDKTVQVWDATMGNRFFTLRGHSDWVLDVAWSPSGMRIASASLDRTVQIWDATKGSHLFTYRGHRDGVESVAWSPDGKYIASGSVDRTVQVWDASTGSPIYTYRGHSIDGRDVAWSPDGKRIASGGFDTTVQVWDATTGKHAFIYHDHSGYVYAVAWARDGIRIASASYDHTVQVWIAANGDRILTYRGHSGAVEAVAWSPDNTYIASGGEDKTVQVWKAP